MNRQLKADLWLLLITGFWGMSYLLTDICLTEMPPMTLIAFRFLTAFALLGLLFRKNLRRMNRQTRRCGLIVGLALTATYIFYGYGVPRTSVSNASFICCLAVVFTPILGRMFFHARLTRRQVLCIGVCVAGLALLTLNDNLRPSAGDIICMGVPVCYALDLLFTEQGVKTPGVDPLAMGVCSVGVVGVLTLAPALLTEEPRVPQSPTVWVCALLLGIFCSGITFAVQSVQQRYTTASHVGLIFTLEPVFASVVAYFVMDERLPARGYVGMAIMLLSLVLMELKPEPGEE